MEKCFEDNLAMKGRRKELIYRRKGEETIRNRYRSLRKSGVQGRANERRAKQRLLLWWRIG